MQHYLNAWRNFGNFSGRARRAEFWQFKLINMLILGSVGSLVTLIESMNETISNGISMLFFLFFIALIIPSLSVLFRRLHDANMSGWFILLRVIPVFGALILLVMCCLEGTQGPNKYGISPKYPELSELGQDIQF